MHRHVLQSTSSSTLRRAARQLPSVGRHNSTRAHKISSDAEEKDTLVLMRKVTKAVITRAAAGESSPGWKVSEASKLKASLNPTTSPISLKLRKEVASDEKAMFSQPDSEYDLDMASAFLGEQIAPGSFVEVRRNFRPTTGVVVQTQLESGGWRTVTLTTDGDLWDHAPMDVMFVIPGFVSSDLAARCRREIESSKRHGSAIQILRRVREFERAAEKVYNGMSRHIPRLYQHVKSQDPRRWARITTPEAAKLISYEVDSPIMKLFVVHKHLMARSERFIANPAEYVVTQAFDVRPEVDVDLITEVDAMVRRNAPAVTSFVNKVHEVVALAQLRAEDSWNEPPTMSGIDTRTTFTEEEQMILQYLKLAFHKRRNIQEWHFQTTVAQLAKQIYRSPGAFSRVNDDLLHKLVMDLGLIAPWHDIATHERMLKQDRLPMEPTLRAKEIDKLVEKYTKEIRKKPSPITETRKTGSKNQTLTAEDFYPVDPVESIRHDFGNLPVYVIDDVGAEELDDGLSIERDPSHPGTYWMHIHIADPTSILHPGNQISLNARTQLETNYMIHTTEPMIPASLMKHMSLGRRSAQGLPERVMTFSVKVDSVQGVIDRKVRAGLVRNVKILKYDQVDAALGIPTRTQLFPFGGAPPPHPSASEPIEDAARTDLAAMHDIAQTLVQERLRQDIFYFSVPRASVSYTTPQQDVPRSMTRLDHPIMYRGFPGLRYEVSEYKDMDTGSRAMIAEFMKVACHTASIFALERGIAGIRRSAMRIITPSEEAFAELMARRGEHGEVAYTDAVKFGAISPPAKNTLEPGEHWMLGIPDGEGYMRVTSPLRRFEDMANHWALKAALLPGEKSLELSEGWIEGVIHDCNVRGPVHRSHELLHARFWVLTYLRRWCEGRIPVSADGPPQVDVNNMEGIILDPARVNIMEGGFVARVFVPGLGLMASLKTDSALSGLGVGAPIRVKLANILLGFNAAATLTRV